MSQNGESMLRTVFLNRTRKIVSIPELTPDVNQIFYFGTKTLLSISIILRSTSVPVYPISIFRLCYSEALLVTVDVTNKSHKSEIFFLIFVSFVWRIANLSASLQKN